MKHRHPPMLVPLIVAGSIAWASVLAFAQESVPASAPLALPAFPEAPASVASASAPARQVGPRMRSSAETGNSAAAPGDLHPERAVTPQINIPFGKTQSSQAPQTRREVRAARRSEAPTAGTIDDAAARCESQPDDASRAGCRAKLAREAKGRLPN